VALDRYERQGERVPYASDELPIDATTGDLILAKLDELAAR
jgi:hypothetical protein